MWNDSKPPLLSVRDTKGSKTPKTTFLKSSRTDTVLKGVIRRGLATLFAVSLNVQTGASNINVFTVQACVCCNRGRTSPIYLHVVMFSSLLFVPALFNVALVPPPVLADPTGSRVCRRAMLAAPSLRGWIRCVCHGERWLGVGSTEARWVLEQAAIVTAGVWRSSVLKVYFSTYKPPWFIIHYATHNLFILLALWNSLSAVEFHSLRKRAAWHSLLLKRYKRKGRGGSVKSSNE